MIFMGKEYRSNHLRIVIQAYKELGIKVAHRSLIIIKWKEIREKEGLDPVHDNWVDYVLHAYPEFFKSVRKGSGDWEYIGD